MSRNFAGLEMAHHIMFIEKNISCALRGVHFILVSNCAVYWKCYILFAVVVHFLWPKWVTWYLFCRIRSWPLKSCRCFLSLLLESCRRCSNSYIGSYLPRCSTSLLFFQKHLSLILMDYVSLTNSAMLSSKSSMRKHVKNKEKKPNTQLSQTLTELSSVYEDAGILHHFFNGNILVVPPAWLPVNFQSDTTGQ